MAAYCRVSTDSDAQLESIDAQKTHYENYINGREDWEFVGLYFDEGISGTKKEKRPALLQMIADCKAGKIDFVITKSISVLQGTPRTVWRWSASSSNWTFRSISRRKT